MDLKFGLYLNAYFDLSAEKFDPPSKKPQEEIVKTNKKYYGNLVSKKVCLDIFEVNPQGI